jgi:hypothetical protein
MDSSWKRDSIHPFLQVDSLLPCTDCRFMDGWMDRYFMFISNIQNDSWIDSSILASNRQGRDGGLLSIHPCSRFKGKREVRWLSCECSWMNRFHAYLLNVFIVDS